MKKIILTISSMLMFIAIAIGQTEANKIEVQNLCKQGELCRYSDEKKAIQCFSDAIAKDPYCIVAYRERGFIYKGQEDYKKAIPDYKKTAELSKNAVSYSNLAEVYVLDSLFGAAIIACDSALQIDSLLRAIQIRATAYAQIKECKKAIKDYGAAIRKMSAYDKNRYEYIYNKGLNLYWIGDYYSANIEAKNAIIADHHKEQAYVLYKNTYNAYIEAMVDQKIMTPPQVSKYFDNELDYYKSIAEMCLRNTGKKL